MAAKYTDTITTRAGTVIPGAIVQLLDGSGALVTTYTDDALTQNPATQRVADDNGLVELFVADGTYTVRQTYGSVSTDLPNVELYDLSTIASTSSGAVANKAQASAIGISGSDSDLGTFTGSTIPDNQTAKAAIQALETATEARPTSAVLAASSGASLIGFLQFGTGAVARTEQDKSRERVSVKDFGAVGDGVTDDTAAIQAAITAVGAAGGGSVFFPAGTYKVTSTITINKPNVRLIGVGDGSLITPTVDMGDVFKAYPATGANLQGFRMKDLYIYTTVDTTSGAQIHLDRCNGFRIDHVRLNNHFGGIHVDGSVHGYIDADIQSDAMFAATRANSYLLKTTKGSDGTVPAEIHVAKCDWRGVTGNNRLNYVVLLQCVDGIWFDQPHFGFCQVGMALNPGADTHQLTSVVVRGGYLDTCSVNLLQAFRPSATYSADWGLHSLDFATQYNSGSDGWNWFCISTGNNFWSQIQLGNMFKLGAAGINVGKGTKLSFKPGWAIIAPSYSTASQPGILLNNDVSQIRVGKGTVDKDSSPNTPNAALQSTTSVDKFEVDVIHAINCSAGILDSSVTANKTIASAVTW